MAFPKHVEQYVADLQQTKTYQAGLIQLQDYAFKSRWGGLIRTLPPVPHADDDRHVIVLEMRGQQPNLFTILADPRHSISPTSRDAEKLLFIFVEMKQRITKINTPSEGYQLADGHQIRATFQVTYRVSNAERFWKESKDPLDHLETIVIDEAKNYFLKISTDYLISRPAELKQSLERQIEDTGIKIVKNGLEEGIQANCIVGGLDILKVNADVHLSDTLREHLERLHKRIYGEGEYLDKRHIKQVDTEHRRYIDTLIDEDPTFAPYTLRQVIMTLDTGLLENFYIEDWNNAITKVHNAIANKKEAYQNAEISRLEKLLKTAQRLELDEEDVNDIKEKLADKLLKSADEDNHSQMHSDNEFLQLILGSPDKRLTAGAAGQIPADVDDNEAS